MVDRTHVFSSSKLSIPLAASSRCRIICIPIKRPHRNHFVTQHHPTGDTLAPIRTTSGCAGNRRLPPAPYFLWAPQSGSAPPHTPHPCTPHDRRRIRRAESQAIQPQHGGWVQSTRIPDVTSWPVKETRGFHLPYPCRIHRIVTHSKP